jgi:hypothetical protein
MIEVTNEDDAPALADDPWNYDFEEEDIQMSSPESSIAADDCNYDSGLEPTPAIVPPEQQASSSCMTLDDLPPADVWFLGFHLRAIKRITPDSQPAFVEEIMQYAMETDSGAEWVEEALRFMSEVFDEAGRLLGRQCRSGKGKGKEHAP